MQAQVTSTFDEIGTRRDETNYLGSESRSVESRGAVLIAMG
jgi:hypothetical protein